MPSFVYILENDQSTFYIGYTADLDKRINEHLNDSGGWTAGRGPWKLRYFETFNDDTEARRREIKLKRAKNKTYLSWLCDNGPGSSVG